MRKLWQLKRLLYIVVMVAALLVYQQTTWAAEGVRVLIETDGYALGKFEPASGTYLGAYVLQDTFIEGDMATFNDWTGKKHASFFRYVGYGQDFPEQWLDDLKRVGAVPHIAWEPNEGLEAVQDDEYLRNFAQQLKRYGLPVFLRFASEMNGDWTAYSGNPQQYIEKWRLVHDVMAEEAPNVMMVWTVFTSPQSTILKFYPGDDYVDWVGVNIYNVVYHNDNLRLRADHEDPLELLDYVYNTFSDRKPIQISEYGVTHFTTTDNQEYVDFAVQKLTRLYEGLKHKYPRVKSIFYFDVNNLVNAPDGRRINNYALTDNQVILAAYASLVQDPHYLSEVAEDRAGQLVPQFFNVKDSIYTINGTTYLSSRAVRQYLGAAVSMHQDYQTLLVTKGGSTFSIPVDQCLTAGAAFVKNGISYLPLRVVAAQLGYRVKWDAAGNVVTVAR